MKNESELNEGQSWYSSKGDTAKMNEDFWSGDYFLMLGNDNDDEKTQKKWSKNAEQIDELKIKEPMFSALYSRATTREMKKTSSTFGVCVLSWATSAEKYVFVYNKLLAALNKLLLGISLRNKKFVALFGLSFESYKHRSDDENAVK